MRQFIPLATDGERVGYVLYWERSPCELRGVVCDLETRKPRGPACRLPYGISVNGLFYRWEPSRWRIVSEGKGGLR